MPLHTLFPDIHTQEQLLSSMDELTLVGGWTCVTAGVLAYATLPSETAYQFVTSLTTAYVVAVWSIVVRSLCKSVV